jgi:hypothetical protein
MTPLDLTLGPPRPCRAELDGIIFLPRAIDKVRAALPGGNLGLYLNLSPDVATLSSLFYRRMGITHDEFSAAVAEAADEAAVAAWLRARIDERAVEKFTQQLLGLKLGGLPEDGRQTVHELYRGAASAPDDTLLIDLIDADDAALFARS